MAAKRLARAAAILCGIPLALACVAVAEIPHPPVLLLTSQDNGMAPEDTFSCSGTIHGFLTLRQPQVGSHLLEAIWTGPSGRVIEHSRDELTYPAPGGRTAAVRLEFIKEGKRIWNPVSVQDPGDEDRALYDGSWRVEVRWDHQTLARSTFEVRCL